MTIHLPPHIERDILAEVHSGHFASIEDAVAEAWRSFRQHRQSPAPASGALRDEAAQADKPIWEVFQELSASVPDEVWDALPTDLSEQHDHYIYGTPKRPTA